MRAAQAPGPAGPGNTPPVRLPDRRLLKAFRFDPMSSRLGGRHLTLDIPFETGLQPGPMGDLLHVVDYDPGHQRWYEPVDLDDPAILAQRGLRPSERDPRAHQQVVYAVAMSVLERFERFLGRRFRWTGGRQLRLVPHAFEGRNAYFDPDRTAVLFGYYRAERDDPGPNLPGQMMFTCLSVDIVAHEVTHAIVHRMRRYLSEPTNPDVFAWHEACADLVALFHHFAFRDVVAEAVATSRGRLQQGSALLDLASEFGHATGRGAALRRAVGSPADPEAFLRATEPHERGACFVAGVFDAYLDVYRGRIADLRRLATGGTGVLPPGALPPDLVDRVTTEAVENAERVLGMVVRAFDLLPVVDVTFGDAVRAIVTADRSLYPDDGLQLRATLVESLRRRGIWPTSVSSLADEALTWPRPARPLSLTGDPGGVDLSALILAATRDLDVEAPMSAEHGATSQRDAEAHGQLASALRAWAGAHALELGLDPASAVDLAGVHVSYHQAADRQPRPVVVLQLVQRRPDLEDQHADPRERLAVRAGTTVLARVDGTVTHLVTKPLPLSDPAALDAAPADVRAFAAALHEAGARRLHAMRAWADQVAIADPLAVWTDQPALRRLTFARLHAEQSEGMR